MVALSRSLTAAASLAVAQLRDITQTGCMVQHCQCLATSRRASCRPICKPVKTDRLLNPIQSTNLSHIILFSK